MTAIAKVLLSVLLVFTFSAAAGNNIYLPIILNQPTPIPTAPPTPTISPRETPLPTATNTPQPTATPQPAATNTPQPGVCACSGDLYNCSDFSTQAGAQACFNHCLSVGAGDIHKLDRDNNGVACEALPLNWGYWK